MNTVIRGALAPKVDVRDYSVAAAAAEYPKAYSLEDLPAVKNQGIVGSCVAHTTAEILEYFNKVETGNYIPLSTDFIYGMQGVALGRKESGMYLRDACKIAQTYGDCRKDTISTNTEQPQCTDKLAAALNDDVYAEAEAAKILSYARCKSESAIRHAIMNYGPVLGSTYWHDKYESKDKIISFDKTSEGGYHAIMIYGWNENGWLCQNSWGEKWNGDGHFVLPYGEVKEAWSFVDIVNYPNAIKKPKSNSWLDKIYKIINAIINFFKGEDK